MGESAQVFQESKICCAFVVQDTEPEGLVVPIQFSPSMEGCHSQTEQFTDSFGRQPPAAAEARQHLEDEGQAVSGEGYDAVRKDCVSMAAASADNAEDADPGYGRPAAPEIDASPGVVCVDPALPFCLTVWAGLRFGPEGDHEAAVYLLRGTTVPEELAEKRFLSYHDPVCVMCEGRLLNLRIFLRTLLDRRGSTTC